MTVVYISKSEERYVQGKVEALGGRASKMAISIPFPLLGQNVSISTGDIVQIVLNNPQVTDNHIISILEALPDLKYVYLDSCSVTDKTLAAIKDRPIEHLSLTNTSVTDEGMSNIVSMPNLRILVLSDTDITDRGLATLSKRAYIGRLELDGTKITNSGLIKFVKSGCSATLSVRDAAVTKEGFQKALSLNPNLHIER